MANREVDRTLADFIAGALSPPLIMAMVGSLVFFLLEICYAGLYRGTLQWVLFFFVFGAVLIARMSMHSEIAGRAGLYGFVLGGLVWLALRTYVDYSDSHELARRGGLVNLGLIVLIWWSAHRLTWDCTFLNHESAGPGAGLLDQAGILSTALAGSPPEGGTPTQPKKSKRKMPEDHPGMIGWWERYRLFRDRRKVEPRTRGVWVVIFSLAALPLFGLGQSQIPATELERRNYTFVLLRVYVAAGLGLLLTTSFLGLRHYLRERKVTMPLGITLSWMILGSLMIAGALFIGTLLPRPADPQPLWDWTGLTVARERDPAPWSPMREKDLRKKKSDQTGKDDADKRTSSDPDKSQEDPKSDTPSKSGKEAKSKSSAEKKSSGDKGLDDKSDQEHAEPQPATTKESNISQIWGKLAEFLLKLVRILIIVLLVLIFVFWIGRGILRFLANFTFWAKHLLAMFENLWQNVRTKEADTDDEPLNARPRPFATFANPFKNGQAQYLSPAELVRFSFAALEAWGREHDVARNIGETPLEFAGRIGDIFPWLETDSANLASLYARLAYSTDTLTGTNLDGLRGFWRQLSEPRTLQETV